MSAACITPHASLLGVDSFYGYEVSADAPEVSIRDVKHTHKTINSFKIDEEDDWGFCLELMLDDLSQDETEMASEDSKDSSGSSSPSSSAMGMNCASRCSSNLTVICEVEDKKAPMSCRSFELKEGVISTACVIEGLRLVQDDSGEDAEFKVRLLVAGKEYVAWRRFSDFQVFGEACRLYSQSAGSFMLAGTVSAWTDIMRHRPWFRRCLEIPFLLEELALFELFLKSVLFETPTIDLLLDFMR
ncbi:hypothetical protein B484DRAFT_448717 [Ochromonadaceae sp. CCMP2298]|nr:hypothetical protein B484DRAFT_448717 [Ochromonadaceae sp. CCMP2298]